MIISAAIVSKQGTIFQSKQLPLPLQEDISKHAKNFLYSMSIADEEVEFPYIETTNLRYIYKESGDLYWLLVTKLDSEMFADIHLLGKFVCTIMEYGLSETNSSTLTDEQVELFYRHIWRPWDDDTQCPFCNFHWSNSSEFWEREFDNRLQFLISIRDGHVDDSDVDYFNRLLAEAWSISAELSPKWGRIGRSGNIHCVEDYDALDSDTDSTISNEIVDKSISEEALIDGCRLKCRLEDIRIELGRIQDPYLRLFAKRNLLYSADNAYNNQQVCSAPLYKDMNMTAQSDQSILFENN